MWWKLIGLPLVLVGLDQYTKYLTVQHMTLGESIPILGDIVRLTFIRNAGMAFGIQVSNQMFFTSLSVAVMVLIAWSLYRVRHASWMFWLPLSMIFGGAIGNIIDRVMVGNVVDFMDVDIPDFHFPGWDVGLFQIPSYELLRWPVFNVADSAITVGMVILLIVSFFGQEPEMVSRPAAETESLS
jgi:signal peptidase II